MRIHSNVAGILGFAALLWICAGEAQAKLNVFACEPEWAALLSERGRESMALRR